MDIVSYINERESISCVYRTYLPHLYAVDIIALATNFLLEKLLRILFTFYEFKL